MNTETLRALTVLSLLALVQACEDAGAPSGAASAAPPPDPLVFDTWVPGPCSPNGQAQGQCPPGELFRVRLVPVAEGLTNPRHVAFMPNGDLLIAELAGRVRVVRSDKLAPEPLAGWPAAGIEPTSLQAVAVHPQFATNHFVYLYYVKSDAEARTTLALARARLEGSELADVREVFETDAWIQGGPIAGRAVFGPDGMIYLTINDHDKNNAIDDPSVRIFAQHLDSDLGKVLRVRDDGGIPADNPFVGREDHNSQVFTYGHRNTTDFAWHPTTGELWATEIGPMGGDEINILRAGSNYGWPLVSLGKLYTKGQVSEQHWYREGMEMPFMHWTPSISPNSLVWYTGDKLLLWQGNLFVGALNGQTLQRIAFDQPAPQSERRDSLFMSLGRRWRHVAQSPDGYLYAATEKRTLGSPSDPNDATSGVVYRIEPAD
ncbi:MAG: PQQ-dependent sugar dehydrogenase [Lysobacterales bacterium]|nr:MAG: PQQ-dependent sugar dehydrogenase [Xanthomonadales bacterium]